MHGQERPCGLCGGTMRFDEHHVVVRGDVSRHRPVWLCRCGNEIVVRDWRPGRTDMSLGVEPHADLANRGSMKLIELRRAVAELRERAQDLRGRSASVLARARRAVERSQQLAVGTIALDHQARMLAANRAAFALTGYTERELSRLTLWQLTAEKKADETRKHWDRFLLDGHFEGRCALRRKTGEHVAVECVAAANVVPGFHVGALATRRLLRALAS